jgi:soluble P-type ATPase
MNESPRETKNDVIRELKTRYMLWPGIKYPMYSFQSKSDWIIFTPRRKKLDYIYSSQLNSKGTNHHAKQNDLIRELKTRYMLWSGI